jgi:SAM-dependent methyltransferase
MSAAVTRSGGIRPARETVDRHCPFCGSANARLLLSADQIRTDLVPALVRGDKLMHSYAADLFDCEACATIFRDPTLVPRDLEQRYRADPYEPGELERLWRAGIAECRRQRGWLRSQGLHAGARVLEIGSYVGSFLSFAREMGCEAVGVDIGRDVAAFARARGLDVYTEPFTSDLFRDEHFDSVWILNCFEQLPDISAVVRHATTVLASGGRLVIRTPSADFVRAAYQHDTAILRRILDANGLLGVPFAKCLSPTRLQGLLAEHHVGHCRLRGHELGSRPPAGYPTWWPRTRRVRNVGYAVASRRTGEMLYPWVDLTGVLERPHRAILNSRRPPAGR